MLDQVFLGLAAETDHHAVGFAERLNGPAQAKVFRRAREVELRIFFFQSPAGSQGENSDP